MLKQGCLLEEGVVRGGEEAKAENLLKQLAGKQDDLVYNAFNILRENSKLVQNLTQLKSKALKNLCSVQAVSTELGFGRLVQNARLESTKSANAIKMLKGLVQKVATASESKVRKAFDNLAQHAQLEFRESAYQIKIVKGLGQTVANACQSNLRKAVDSLLQHALVVSASHSTAISNITKNIVAQDNQCLCLCYFALKKACIVDDGVKLGSGRTKKDNLVRALVGTQYTIEYMAYWLLRNNSGYLIVKEQEQAKKIALGNDSRNMALISFVNNQVISLDLAWRKLLGNAEFSGQASKNSKQLRTILINRLVSASSLLPAIAFSLLLANHHLLSATHLRLTHLLTHLTSTSSLLLSTAFSLLRTNHQLSLTSHKARLKSFTNFLSQRDLSVLNICYISLKSSHTLAKGISIGKAWEKKTNFIGKINTKMDTLKGLALGV